MSFMRNSEVFYFLKGFICDSKIDIVQPSVMLVVSYYRPTRLLNATGIEGGIHNPQVLKYQPSVTSRVIFYHLIPLIIIKY